MTQLELDWVRERRATLERARPSVPSETREIEVSAEAFAEYEQAAPYRGSAHVWVVRPPENAPPTSASTDATPDDRSRVLLLLPRGDQDHWGLPGGGVEPGEDYETAAVREVREETGVDCEVGAPWLFLHRIWSVPDAPDASHSLHVFYRQSRASAPGSSESQSFSGSRESSILERRDFKCESSQHA